MNSTGDKLFKIIKSQFFGWNNFSSDLTYLSNELPIIRAHFPRKQEINSEVAIIVARKGGFEL
jgi:hypothetical protein